MRTLGQMSRSLMLGAPHLPTFVWGMSDLYAAWIHMTLPQKTKGRKSPYEITTGREPDDDVLFIRVFGCPCQYEQHMQWSISDLRRQNGGGSLEFSGQWYLF